MSTIPSYRHIGAGDETRTRTVLPPKDFKSFVSSYSTTPAYCERMHLVLRHRNSYPYANASADFSGKANPFVTYFNSHLLGWRGGIRTPECSSQSAVSYRLTTLQYVRRLIKPPLLILLAFLFLKVTNFTL